MNVLRNLFYLAVVIVAVWVAVELFTRSNTIDNLFSLLRWPSRWSP